MRRNARHRQNPPSREAEADRENAIAILQQCLQEQTLLLAGIIGSYILRMGLAQGEAARVLANEVLNDTAIEALASADRFDPTTQPTAWLLGIAANLLKRRKTQHLRSQRREVLVSDLINGVAESSEAVFFKRMAALVIPGPEQAVEDAERVTELLSLVSLPDQQVLRWALLDDLDGQSLAQRLNQSPGAARVRLHRALNRLRLAWAEAQKNRVRDE